MYKPIHTCKTYAEHQRSLGNKRGSHLTRMLDQMLSKEKEYEDNPENWLGTDDEKNWFVKYLQLLRLVYPETQLKNNMDKEEFLKTGMEYALFIHEFDKWTVDEQTANLFKAHTTKTKEILDLINDLLETAWILLVTRGEFKHNNKLPVLFSLGAPLYVLYELELKNEKKIALNLNDWGHIILMLCRLKDTMYTGSLNDYVKKVMCSESYTFQTIYKELKQFMVEADETIRKELELVFPLIKE